MIQVSVIIPCFNAAQWIRETLNSVFSQEIENLEIIVIDDGSTDESANIIEKEFPAIRLIRTKNQGASKTRNLGTEMSKGEFIQYLDADDLLAPDKLRLQLEILQNSGADVAYGNWQELRKATDGKFVKAKEFKRKIQNPEIDLFTDFWCPPAVYLFRSSIVEKVGGYREDLPIIQDARFSLDCALHGGRFFYCEGIMAYYRVYSEASLSRRDSIGFVRDCLRNALQVEDWWRGHGGINKERKKALLRVYGYIARASFNKDNLTFECAYRALNKLIPVYMPEKLRILKLLSRLFGYKRADAFAFWYRRIKRSIKFLWSPTALQPWYLKTAPPLCFAKRSAGIPPSRCLGDIRRSTTCTHSSPGLHLGFSARRRIKRGLSFIFRFVKSYFGKRRFSPRQIPRLDIETTNICDAKCVFCANSTMKRKREPLDMNLFKKAVDEFATMGGAVIDFNAVIGDPLFDPYLLERARYTRQFPQFKSLGFVTNLQWLDKFDMDEFFNCGINWLGISTTLSGREKYLEFFGVDRYEQTLKNILTLIEENKKRGNKMVLRFSIKPTNESVEDVIVHPDFKMISSLLTQDISSMVKNQSLYVDDWLGCVNLPAFLKKRPLYPRAFRPCGLLYTGLILFSNGNIGACSCRDFEADSDLILGNIRQVTLKEAWNAEKLAGIRYNWRRNNKIPDICKRCAHYVY